VVIKLFSPSEHMQALPHHARGTARTQGGPISDFATELQAGFAGGILMGNASQGSGACPKCDEIYAEMWELRMRLVDWVRGWGPLSHAERHARQVLSAKPKQLYVPNRLLRLQCHDRQQYAALSRTGCHLRKRALPAPRPRHDRLRPQRLGHAH